MVLAVDAPFLNGYSQFLAVFCLFTQWDTIHHGIDGIAECNRTGSRPIG